MNFSSNYELIDLEHHDFVIDESLNLENQFNVTEDVFEDVSHEFGNPDGGFEGREALDLYVRYIAGIRNITLAIRSSKTNVPGRQKWVKYQCTEGGQYRNQKVEDLRKTKSAKNYCPFTLVGREWVSGQDRWFIEVRNGKHNHHFPKYAVGSRLGTISSNEYEVIQEQEALSVSASNMLDHLKRVDPANVTDQKRVYNAIYKARKDKREGRSPIQNFIYVLNKRNYK